MEILEQVIDILKKIPKEYYLPISVGCIGLMLFVYGFFVVIDKQQPRENSLVNSFSQPSEKQNLGSNSFTGNIKVDVEGAIVTPGVYTLSANARVQDALVAAGGFSEKADRVWVAQHVNLALKLNDGTKIYIPSADEVAQGNAAGIGQSSSSDILGAQNQQININTASESDLDSLPGVGQVTAQKIISSRPYSSTQDLLTKQIVGQKEFEKIKDLIIAN